MGYRYYDWECNACRATFPGLLWVEFGQAPSKHAAQYCPRCEDHQPCDRLMSAPAPYMGERPWCPTVIGGSFDTMGQRPTRALPMPADGATRDVGAMRDHFRSAEWRDAKAQRTEQDAVNARKRQRADLMKQGKRFNLRRSEDRLPGDPKI